MKYLSISAMLLASSAMLYTQVYASESNQFGRNVSDTEVSPRAGQAIDVVFQQLSARYEIREPIPFATVKEFAAVLFALPGLQSVKIVKYGEYLGFYVKITGLPADGYALYL